MTRKAGFLSTIMAMAIFFSTLMGLGTTTAGAAANPAFTVTAVTDLAYNNARINAKITNPAKTKITKVGFQLGTTNGKWTYNKYDSVSMKYASITANYLMSKYKVTLTENKKYFYRFYMTTGGKTYYSKVCDFKTPVKGKYTKINSVGISRIYQPANDKYGSCYLSSIASLYGFKTGKCRTAGKDYAQSCAVYKEVYKKNSNTTYVYDSTVTKLGLKKQSYNLQTIYNSLKAGKPVVVYTGKHASIVIGYTGNNKTSLSIADFVIMEIKGGYYSTYYKTYVDKGYWDNSSAYFKSYANNPSSNYFNSKSCYIKMSSWAATTGTPKYMVLY